MSNKILFTKVRDVKTPERAYTSAAATDFFIPNYSHEFHEDLINKNPHKEYYECTISPNRDVMSIVIAPNGRLNIPSGIKVVMEDSNMCLLAANKSGLATKHGLICGAVLIDADYRGEIHLSVINTSPDPIVLKTGDKLIQFMYLPVVYPTFSEISNTEYDNYNTTDRGSNGFGSSG